MLCCPLWQLCGYGRAQPRLRVASFLTAAIGRRCWCVGTSKEAPRAPDARSVSASSPDPVAGWMQGLERRRAIESKPSQPLETKTPQRAQFPTFRLTVFCGRSPADALSRHAKPTRGSPGASL